MIQKIVQVVVVIVCAVIFYWVCSLLLAALGFIYTNIALALIAFLLAAGVIVFTLRVFGINF